MKRSDMKDNDCKIKNHIYCKKHLDGNLSIKEVIEMQKQLEEASEQSQQEIKSLLEETTMLRRGIDESGKFPKSMSDWKSSEQYEDIRELQTNNIALQDSSTEAETSFGKVTLSPDCSESLVKRLTHHIRVAGNCTAYTGKCCSVCFRVCFFFFFVFCLACVRHIRTDANNRKRVSRTSLSSSSNTKVLSFLYQTDWCRSRLFSFCCTLSIFIFCAL